MVKKLVYLEESQNKRGTVKYLHTGQQLELEDELES